MREHTVETVIKQFKLRDITTITTLAKTGRGLPATGFLGCSLNSVASGIDNAVTVLCTVVGAKKADFRS